MQRQTLIYFSY